MYHYYIFGMKQKKMCARAKKKSERTSRRESEKEQKLYTIAKCEKRRMKQKKNGDSLYFIVFHMQESRKYIACNDILYFHFGYWNALLLPVTLALLAKPNHNLVCSMDRREMQRPRVEEPHSVQESERKKSADFVPVFKPFFIC